MLELRFILIIAILIMLFSNAEASEQKNVLIELNPLSIPSSLHIGDEMRFMGRLFDADSGEGIVGEEIVVINNKPSKAEILQSVKTRKYGLFTINLNVTTEDPKRDGMMYILVRFDGSEHYRSAVSREYIIMVKPLPIEIKFHYIKKLYREGERAEIIFSVSSTRGPIEPDRILTYFDSKFVSITRYGEGYYIYETIPLKKGFHQFIVNVTAYGYKDASEAITIEVV